MPALPTSQTPFSRNQIMGMEKSVADVMILNRGHLFSGMFKQNPTFSQKPNDEFSQQQVD